MAQDGLCGIAQIGLCGVAEDGLCGIAQIGLFFIMLIYICRPVSDRASDRWILVIALGKVFLSMNAYAARESNFCFVCLYSEGQVLKERAKIFPVRVDFS